MTQRRCASAAPHFIIAMSCCRKKVRFCRIAERLEGLWVAEKSSTFCRLMTINFTCPLDQCLLNSEQKIEILSTTKCVCEKREGDFFSHTQTNHHNSRERGKIKSRSRHIWSWSESWWDDWRNEISVNSSRPLGRSPKQHNNHHTQYEVWRKLHNSDSAKDRRSK